MKRFIRR